MSTVMVAGKLIIKEQKGIGRWQEFRRTLLLIGFLLACSFGLILWKTFRQHSRPTKAYVIDHAPRPHLSRVN